MYEIVCWSYLHLNSRLDKGWTKVENQIFKTKIFLSFGSLILSLN